MYCELCLLYCISCAVLYTINVVQELNKSGIVCVLYYVTTYIMCIVYHVLFVLYCMNLYTASIGCCVSKLCTVYVSPVLCLQPSVPCVLVLYCISTTASAVCCVC